MTEGIFFAPPPGIGADTGNAVFSLGAEERLQRSICEYEAPDGRRKGPLLLTVNTVGVLGYLGSSLAGAAAVESMTFDAWGDPAWSLLGSMVVDMQVGAVRKSLIADLASGTYQLPPCDAVMVSAALFNTELSGRRDLVVQAAVTPGEARCARPMVYTQQAITEVPMSGNDVIVRQSFPRPPHAHGARAEGQLVGATPTANVQAVCSLDANRYQWEQAPGPFLPVLPWTGSMAARFVLSNTAVAAGVHYMLAAQWRIDP